MLVIKLIMKLYLNYINIQAISVSVNEAAYYSYKLNQILWLTNFFGDLSAELSSKLYLNRIQSEVLTVEVNITMSSNDLFEFIA